MFAASNLNFCYLATSTRVWIFFVLSKLSLFHWQVICFVKFDITWYPQFTFVSISTIGSSKCLHFQHFFFQYFEIPWPFRQIERIVNNYQSWRLPVSAESLQGCLGHPWEAWAVQDGTLIWPHEVMIILISSFTTQTDSHTALINLNSWVTNSDIDLITNLISMRWLFTESDMKPSTSLNVLMSLVLNQNMNLCVLFILWSIWKSRIF